MADRHGKLPPAAKPILQIQDLQVYYGESHALQGVSLDLARGILSVVGRNGMGKTTLCNTIAGLMRARSGAIRFEPRYFAARRP
jgi:ABC-type branched-subunit amino acid transport system ATPase component